MKIAVLIARLLLGLMFLVFGLNGFLHFFPDQPMPDGLAKRFIAALMDAHYIPVVSGIEVASAVLFLVNRFVPLALVLLGPILVNILLFHLLIMPQGIAIGAFATVLWFVIFFYHRAAFARIFEAKA